MKIICFRNSKLGDYLISIPTLQLIKKKFGNCNLIYLSDFNKNCKYLPKNIEDNKIVDSFFFYKNSFLGFLNLLLKLRRMNIDMIVNLQEETTFYKKIRNFIFFSLCNIPAKIGFFYKNKDYKKYSETVQLVKRVESDYKISNIYNLQKIKKKNEKPILKFKYITISHGGVSSPQLWHLESWKKLIYLLIKHYNYKIVIIGSKKEKKAADYLHEIDKKKIVNMCGKTRLKELFNIIKYSKMHITNDNGSMHISTIYSIKTMCMFNNHDPIGKWYPENKNAVIIRPNNGVNSIKPNFIFKKIKCLL